MVADGDGHTGMRAHSLLEVSLYTSQTISKCSTLNYVPNVPKFGPSNQKVRRTRINTKELLVM